MSKGCDHCLHPMWAGIKCSLCGRWADTEPSEALKQAWADYQEALKEFECPRCGHCCRREWKGLTRSEIDDIARVAIDKHDLAIAIEAALKEKNK